MPKEQAFVAIPGEKLLEAIGEVSVKWAALEWQLDNMLSWASDPADTDTARLLKEGSIRKRWNRLKHTVRLEHSTHPGTLGLTLLIDECLQLKGERDKVVHGVYGEDGSNATPEAAIVMLMQGGLEKGRGWAVTRPKVLEVARKIDAMVKRVFDYRMSFAEPMGNAFRLNAWRHKAREQD